MPIVDLQVNKSLLLFVPLLTAFGSGVFTGLFPHYILDE